MNHREIGCDTKGRNGGNGVRLTAIKKVTKMEIKRGKSVGRNLIRDVSKFSNKIHRCNRFEQLSPICWSEKEAIRFLIRFDPTVIIHSFLPTSAN